MSLFHRFRKSVATVTAKEPQPITSAEIETYNDVKKTFDSLQVEIVKILDYIKSYQSHIEGLLMAACVLGREFPKCFESVVPSTNTQAPVTSAFPPNSPVATMLADVTKTHATFHSDEKILQPLHHALRNLCIEPLDQYRSNCTLIMKAIQQRNAHFEEYTYYHNKLNGLRKDDSDPNARLKYERNLKKCEEAQQKFETCNRDIIKDMRECLEDRMIIMSSVMHGFVSVESEFSRTYHHALNSIVKVDITDTLKEMKQNKIKTLQSFGYGIADGEEHNREAVGASSVVLPKPVATDANIIDGPTSDYVPPLSSDPVNNTPESTAPVVTASADVTVDAPPAADANPFGAMDSPPCADPNPFGDDTPAPVTTDSHHNQNDLLYAPTNSDAMNRATSDSMSTSSHSVSHSPPPNYLPPPPIVTSATSHPESHEQVESPVPGHDPTGLDGF